MLCPECNTCFEEEDIVATGDKKRPKTTGDAKVDDVYTETKVPRKGCDLTGYRPRPDQKSGFTGMAWIERHDAMDEKVILSSKMRTLRNVLQAIDNLRSAHHRKDSAGPSVTSPDKVIIFVQWIQVAILIGTMLEEASVPFVYFWVSINVWEARFSRALILFL